MDRISQAKEDYRDHRLHCLACKFEHDCDVAKHLYELWVRAIETVSRNKYG